MLVAHLFINDFPDASLYQKLGTFIAWKHGHVNFLQGIDATIVVSGAGAKQSRAVLAYGTSGLTAPVREAVFLLRMAFISACTT